MPYYGSFGNHKERKDSSVLRKLHGALCLSRKPSGDESLVKLVKHNFAQVSVLLSFHFELFRLFKKETNLDFAYNVQVCAYAVSFV